jgi:hypothetical protein
MRFSARQKEERGPPHLLQPRIEDIAGCEAKDRLYQRVIFLHHPPCCVASHSSTSFCGKRAGSVLRGVENQLERTPWHGFCVTVSRSEHRPHFIG